MIRSELLARSPRQKPSFPGSQLAPLTSTFNRSAIHNLMTDGLVTDKSCEVHP